MCAEWLDPDPTLRFSAGFGVMFGASMAAMRRQNVGFVAVSMGLNYTIFAGSFFSRSFFAIHLAFSLFLSLTAIREAVISLSDASPTMAAAVAGSVSGGMLTLAFTGKMMRGVQGALVWGGAAYLGQIALDAAGSRTRAYKASLLENKAARAEQHTEAATQLPQAVKHEIGEATGQPAARAVTPSATLSSLVAHIDTFEDLPPDMRPAARAEFVRRNKANFERYGVKIPVVHASPPSLSGSVDYPTRPIRHTRACLCRIFRSRAFWSAD